MSETEGHFRREGIAAGRVVGKGLLLLLPFAVLILLELFVLPLDFFTFRIWEAASATPYRYPGAFYPDLKITKSREYGDRYREGGPAQIQSKPVTWYTDHFGWRNRPEVERKPRYDVVVLGDSNIVGSFLDQRDILTEVIGSRSGKIAYSYSIAHDHISLYFSDPRMREKAPKLFVVESRVGTWDTNNSYLFNFRERSDGSLDIVDRSAEMAVHYDPTRNRRMMRLESLWTKQAMFHWLKATLRMDFFLPASGDVVRLAGTRPAPTPKSEAGWRSLNWVASSAVTKPLPGEPQTALAIRAAGVNAYWHTDAFRANSPDGRIVVRFDAKTSVAPSRHKFYVFEDKSYRQVGEIIAADQWRTYTIPATTKPGSLLELQIDQPDGWQWLNIRNFRVEGAGQEVTAEASPVQIPPREWLQPGFACEAPVDDANCGSWPVPGKGGYVQTAPLPAPGTGGYLVRFDARVDKASNTFSRVYVFEGEAYRQAAQCGYTPEWQTFEVPVAVSGAGPVKIQLDLPETAGRLFVRHFQVIPVNAVNERTARPTP